MYGNAIGVDRSGQVALGNAGNGISASGAGAYLTVGSLNAGPGNVIGSNGGSGVLAGTGSSVTISNNTIGLSAANSSTLGNAEPRRLRRRRELCADLGQYRLGNTLHGVDVFRAAGKVLIWDDQIGLNASGTAADPNGQDGVVINGSNGVQVQGNVISGNGSQGGWGGLDICAGEASQGTSVWNNFIGLNAQGTAAVGNLGFGIRVANASTGTTIGGSSGGVENTISGNQGDGILLQGGSTQVLGNNIGTDESGSTAMSNGGYGVDIQAAAATVGGTTADLSNLISANKQGGVAVLNVSSASIAVMGNWIGTNQSGGASLGVQPVGVTLQNAAGVVIGGTTAGAGNVISGNTGDGILVGPEHRRPDPGRPDRHQPGRHRRGGERAERHRGRRGSSASFPISGLTIGGAGSVAANVVSGKHPLRHPPERDDADLGRGEPHRYGEGGQSALGNGLAGVGVARYERPGHDRRGDAGASNVISGNRGDGVVASNAALVQGNKIGTTGDGTVHSATSAMASTCGARDMTIGGTAAAAGNVISGNVGDGVEVAAGASNTIAYNMIGTDAARAAALPNAIGIADGGTSDRIQDNVISGNTVAGSG